MIYIDDDINSEGALTPVHFLSINFKTGIPDIDISYTQYENLANVLLENWKRGQIYLNHFWTIWSNEYLQSLREKHILKMRPIKGEVTRIPRVGEVVIIKEEGLPRGRWKLAKIKNLIKSELDGLIRAVNLVMANGKTIKRPVRFIYPMEGNICNDESEYDFSSNINENDENMNIDKIKTMDIRSSRPGASNTDHLH